MSIEASIEKQPIIPFVEDREERLGNINSFLAERKLRPLKGVGSYEDALMGTELTEVRGVYDRPARFYTVVTFGARFRNPNYDPKSDDPKKKLPYAEGEYNLIFKANGEIADGSVYVTRIHTADGEIAYVLTDQYRVAHNERMLETPRGFASLSDIESLGEYHDTPVDLAKLTGVGALRKLVSETGIKRVRGFTHLGKVAEDSSIEASDANIYLVDADSEMTQQELDLSETGLAVVIVRPDGLYGAIKEGKIRDMHSLAAFMKVMVNDPQEAKRLAEFLTGKKMEESSDVSTELASLRRQHNEDQAEIAQLRRELAQQQDNTNVAVNAYQAEHAKRNVDVRKSRLAVAGAGLSAGLTIGLIGIAMATGVGTVPGAIALGAMLAVGVIDTIGFWNLKNIREKLKTFITR